MRRKYVPAANSTRYKGIIEVTSVCIGTNKVLIRLGSRDSGSHFLGWFWMQDICFKTVSFGREVIWCTHTQCLQQNLLQLT